MEQMKLNGPGRQKLNRKKFMAILRPALDFKGRNSDSCGSLTEGTSNSASAVPHCGKCEV